MYAQSIPVVLIFLTVVVGIFFNNKGLADLKVDLKGDIADLKKDNASLKAELKNDIAVLKIDLKADINRLDTWLNGIQSDLSQFFAVTGKLEGRIDAIEKRVA